MRLTSSGAGTRLKLNQSRPLLQGFIGLALTSAAVVFLVVIARGGLSTVQAGQRLAPSPVVSAVALSHCVLFAVLGLVLAAYRSGTTFDREAREAVQWQRLLVPLTSVRLDVRRFTTVWLKSEVRQVRDDRTNRQRLYREYFLKLTNPRGGELLVGQPSSEGEGRAAARRLADFLGLELLDATVGDAPLPTSGWYVSIDLPGVGPVTVSSPQPAAPPAPESEFRECLDQPAGSRVTLEPFGDGVTLTVPPAGVWAGSKGLLVFGLLWTDVTAVAALFMIPHMSQDKRLALWLPIVLAVFAVVAVAALAGAVQMGRRRAVLAVVGDRLMLLQTGPFGTKRREWRRTQLADVLTGPSGMSVNGVPVMELQVLPRGEGKVGLLGGREESELRWLATVLRKALKIPADSGVTVAEKSPSNEREA